MTGKDKLWVMDLVRSDQLTLRQLQLGIEWKERTGEPLKNILTKISSQPNDSIGSRASTLRGDNGDTIHRRRFRRKSCQTKVDVTIGGETFRAKAHSLSRGGMGIFSQSNYAEGSTLVVQYANAEVIAVVRNAIETDEGWMLGVEFKPHSVDDVMGQEHFLRELLYTSGERI